MRLKPSFFLLLAVSVLLCCEAVYSEPTPKPLDLKTSVEAEIGSNAYHLAIALTPEEQQTGLMYQTRLPKRTGMLFSIKPSRPVAFWMKNTLIPLDMLFVQDGRIARIVHSAPPCQADPCPIYLSEQPVDSVIELPGGTATQDDLKAGDLVRIHQTNDCGKMGCITSERSLCPLSLESRP